jgi:hypothetical protein
VGVDVVVDYLWGRSAETVVVAIAKATEDVKPVRFVQVGGISGGEIALPGAALRSSAIVLMGSGIKSVPFPRLLAAIKSVFGVFVQTGFKMKITTVGNRESFMCSLKAYSAILWSRLIVVAEDIADPHERGCLLFTET